MPNLSKIQKDFSEHLFDFSQLDIVKSLPYEEDEALARLNIYRNNVFGNFYNSLSNIYPKTKEILGEKKFKAISHKYILKYPHSSGNLDIYGEKFPQFIREFESDCFSDFANLELACHQAYYAKEDEDFNVRKFQKIDPEEFFNLKFQLNSSIFLLRSKYAIYGIKNFKKKVFSSKKSEYAFVYRLNGVVKTQKLSEEEFILLSNLNQNKKTFDIYQKIVSLTKKECDIGSMLNKFIANRVIIGFNF